MVERAGFGKGVQRGRALPQACRLTGSGPAIMIGIGEGREGGMVAEIFAGISAFKEMMEIARALKDMDNAMSRRDVVIALQEKIFAGNAAYSELLQRKDELEQEVMRLKDWETEKARYELVELHDGALAYAVKETVRGAEPFHYICPACYQQGKKSILQGATWSYGEHTLACSACNLKIVHSWRDA